MSSIQHVSLGHARRIIETRLPTGLFCAIEDNGNVLAIDNITGDAWTESFNTIRAAEEWLESE